MIEPKTVQPLEKRLASKVPNVMLCAEAEALDLIDRLHKGKILLAAGVFGYDREKRDFLKQHHLKFQESEQQGINGYSSPEIHGLLKGVYSGYKRQFEKLYSLTVERLLETYKTVYGIEPQL